MNYKRNTNVLHTQVFIFIFFCVLQSFLVDISEKCLGFGFPPRPHALPLYAKTKIFSGWGCFFQFRSYIFLAFYTDFQIVTTK